MTAIPSSATPVCKTVEEAFEKFDAPTRIEETLLTHTFSANKNTLEARVILNLTFPDGSEFGVNRVIKLRLKKGLQGGME